MEADLAHDTIHQECGTRHVTRILEQPDKEKEDQDLRKEDDDTTDSCQHSVGEKVPEISGRHDGLQRFREFRESAIDPIHRILGNSEKGEKHQRHCPQEEEPAPDPVSQQVIEPLGEFVACVVCPTLGGMAEFFDSLVSCRHHAFSPKE